MAEVFPFRGYRYNTEKIKDISSVVTQPYDKITSALQEKYYAEHDGEMYRLLRRGVRAFAFRRKTHRLWWRLISVFRKD